MAISSFSAGETAADCRVDCAMQDKLVAAVGDFTFYEYDGTADDSILVVVYGVTAVRPEPLC